MIAKYIFLLIIILLLLPLKIPAQLHSKGLYSGYLLDRVGQEVDLYGTLETNGDKTVIKSGGISIDIASIKVSDPKYIKNLRKISLNGTAKHFKAFIYYVPECIPGGEGGSFYVEAAEVTVGNIIGLRNRGKYSSLPFQMTVNGSPEVLHSLFTQIGKKMTIYGQLSINHGFMVVSKDGLFFRVFHPPSPTSDIKDENEFKDKYVSVTGKLYYFAGMDEQRADGVHTGQGQPDCFWFDSKEVLIKQANSPPE